MTKIRHRAIALFGRSRRGSTAVPSFTSAKSSATLRRINTITRFSNHDGQQENISWGPRSVARSRNRDIKWRLLVKLGESGARTVRLCELQAAGFRCNNVVKSAACADATGFFSCCDQRFFARRTVGRRWHKFAQRARHPAAA